MCIILETTAPSPSTVIVRLGIHVVEDTVSLSALPLRQLGFRGPREPAFATLQAGPQTTEMETGSDVQYVERIFNMVKFAQRTVRQDLCPSMGHLTILGSETN